MSIYNFGGGTRYANPFNPLFGQGFLQNLSPVQQEYLMNDQGAAFGAVNQALQRQGGPQLWQNYAMKWMPDAWRQWQAQPINDPTYGDNFLEYVNKQYNDLQGQFRREMPTRGLTRPTRLLRGR